MNRVTKSWDHSFFLSFFRRVCRYAYGCAPGARLDYMRKYFSHFPGGVVVFCSHCHMILNWRYEQCAFCGGINKQRDTDPDEEYCDNGPEPEAPLFLHLIARYAMVLRLPHTMLALRREYQARELPNSHMMCEGCLTFVHKDAWERRLVCPNKDEHGKDIAVRCGQRWCLPETNGWLECRMCSTSYCGRCVRICDVCNRPGACRKCAPKYECEDVEVGDHENCGTYCVWHAPERRPYQHRAFFSQCVRMYCAKHWDGWRSHDDVKEGCEKCRNGGIEICQAPGCIRCVCMHKGDEEDVRCIECRAVKRMKLETN